MSLENGFPSVRPETIQNAIDRTLEALTSEETPHKVAEFYDADTNYAGATFACLEPRDPNRVTATDLIATTTLAVEIPARAVRRILEDAETSDRLSQLLVALPEYGLVDTNAIDFGRMCNFYDAVKESLAKAGVQVSNPWVTASKLAARKRPDLFPVRDSVVCGYLGIDKLNDRAKDWVVFRELIRNDQVVEQLNRFSLKVRDSAEGKRTQLEHEPLRILDAALWRYSGGGGSGA